MTKDFQNGPNLKKNWLQFGGWGEPIVIKLKNSVVVVLKLWWVSESLGEVGKNRAQTLSYFNKPGAPVFFISSLGGCDTLQILKTTAICGWLKNKISYRWKKKNCKKDWKKLLSWMRHRHSKEGKYEWLRVMTNTARSSHISLTGVLDEKNGERGNVRKKL